MFVLLFCLYIALVNAVVVIVNYLGLFRLAMCGFLPSDRRLLFSLGNSKTTN